MTVHPLVLTVAALEDAKSAAELAYNRLPSGTKSDLTEVRNFISYAREQIIIARNKAEAAGRRIDLEHGKDETRDP